VKLQESDSQRQKTMKEMLEVHAEEVVELKRQKQEN